MIVVVGIGQGLRGDDSAGLAAVRLWEEACASKNRGANIRVEIAESPGIGLLDLLAGAEAAILVDAVVSGRQPGTLHRLGQADLAAFLAGADSAHGWGVAETLALGRQLDPGLLPEKIVIIGIEAGEVGLGVDLTPAVQDALVAAASLIQETLQNLLGSASEAANS